MSFYHANASVIFTDAQGRQIDTFVIFDTDRVTGLTHINHENLKVRADQLVLHTKTIGRYHLPINDAFSFELLKSLRDKYAKIDRQKAAALLPKERGFMHVLAEAS